MKKLLLIAMALLTLTACGVKINKDEVIENNATNTVTRGDVVYSLRDGTLFEGERAVCAAASVDDKLFILGEYAYVNTATGAKQLRLRDGKTSDFGRGEIVAALGENIYYKNVTLFWVNMRNGQQGELIRADAKLLGTYKSEIYFWAPSDGKIDVYAASYDSSKAVSVGSVPNGDGGEPYLFVANDDVIMLRLNGLNTQFYKRSEWFSDEEA